MQETQETQEMQETQVWSLSQDDPLEKEMATYLSILAWKIQVHGVTKDSATSGWITVEAWELRVSHDEKQTKYTYCPVHQWAEKSN